MRHTSIRAQFSYTVEDGVVCVVGDDHGRSITNDAENVIQDLVNAGVDLENQPIIYRDTTGVWDELVVTSGRFAGFSSVGERDKELAKDKIRSRLA